MAEKCTLCDGKGGAMSGGEASEWDDCPICEGAGEATQEQIDTFNKMNAALDAECERQMHEEEQRELERRQLEEEHYREHPHG